ncbi:MULTISPECIES: sporulation protein YqfD [Paenibacillus]|uniref:Sporulation protein YqfD n=1 Tax=Paenibacillus campinasensis TaxID=66347 RepID=A0A268F4N1_9BACL|nr:MULTISPECIES: sporulation protein YqfD [Paenibacillus]MUG64602.1 sporulation protein YqfD [Paenibacillus campinasensis]PAD80327.1 sporulation protein YqfD [Paenibacillus campinasensis]PAK55310.1 sporulation protein YqfD [Paenibacillus sp. 7541]
MNIPTMITVRGYLKLAVRGERVELFINALTEAGIPVWDVKPTGMHAAEIKLLLRDFWSLRPLLKRTGCRTKVIERNGLPFRARNLWRRKAFALGLVLFFALLTALCSMVWDVQVEGNETIADEDILAAAQKEGVYPFQWIFRLQPMDKLSTNMTARLPEASWVGVERTGTRIRIQIAEADIPEKPPLMSPRHLISTRDAVVTRIYAEKGLPKVQVNSRVKKGDILISGVLGDEENSQTVVAKGEVRGLVWHEYDIEVPLVKKHKVYTGQDKERAYLVLGDRAIQLWGYGDIAYAKHEMLTFYDPFTWRTRQLPFGWMTEKIMEVTEVQQTITAEEARTEGIEAAKRDILAKYGADSRFVTQKILHDKNENGKVYMKVLFEVEETIAKELPIVYNQGE